MSKKKISLYDFVKEVRREIDRIRRDVEIRKKPLLYISKLELEIRVVASTTAGGGIKLIPVVAEGKYQTERINTVRIDFTPLVRPLPAKVVSTEEKAPSDDSVVYAFPVTLEEIEHLRKIRKANDAK